MRLHRFKNEMLRENEIRPDKYAQEQARLFRQDVASLVKKKKQFIMVNCPACNKRDYQKYCKKYTLDYVLCNNCQTVFINPRPTPAILDDFYQNSKNYKFWNKYIFPSSEGARRKKVFRPRAQLVRDLCKKYSNRKGTILEIGAGFGTFCEEIKRFKLFKRVIAVEPTPDLAATCRKRGIETIEERIEDTVINDKVDVVVSFEVIEHLFSPEAFLKGCSSVLRKGGIIMLTCPNIKGFDIVVLRELSSAVDAEHLNYFHPGSLALLLKRSGFNVIDKITPGKLDAELVRKKALTGEFKINGHPFLKQILIDEWERVGIPFQNFLADNKLSSHMMLIARKK